MRRVASSRPCCAPIIRLVELAPVASLLRPLATQQLTRLYRSPDQWLCVTRNRSFLTKDSELLFEHKVAVATGREVRASPLLLARQPQLWDVLRVTHSRPSLAVKNLNDRLHEVSTRAEAAEYHALARNNLIALMKSHSHAAGYLKFKRKAGKQSGAGKVRVDGWQVNQCVAFLASPVPLDAGRLADGQFPPLTSSIWHTLAHSLIDDDGALHQTPAKMVCVSLSPEGSGPELVHEFRIYVSNIWWEKSAKAVVAALVTDLNIAKVEGWSVNLRRARRRRGRWQVKAPEEGLPLSGCRLGAGQAL